MAHRGQKGKRGGVTVAGTWLPLSLQFLKSRACAELSPHAVKMLVDMCAQLGANAAGNGDLSAAPKVMKPRGWNGNATRQRALQELIDAGLLSITRMGSRRLTKLYALTLWPIQCDPKKLEHGPGSYATSDWMKGGALAKEVGKDGPPVSWRSLRKDEPRKAKANGEKSQPAAGQPKAVMTPQRVKAATAKAPISPAAGSITPVSPDSVNPPRGTFIDKPSGGAIPLCPPLSRVPSTDATGTTDRLLEDLLRRNAARSSS